MIKNLLNTTKIIFIALCALLFMLIYFDLHKYHIQSFTNFRFYDYLLFLQIFGISLFLVVQFINISRVKLSFYRLISILFILIILSIPVYYVFDSLMSMHISLGQSFSVFVSICSIQACLVMVFLLSILIGNGILGNKYSNKSELSAIGVMLLVTILFIFGSISFLNLFSITILILIKLVLFRKQIIPSLRLLIQPVLDHEKINYWGFILFYILLIALTINFLSILSPYPYGFDARNFYMNSTQLIAQSQGLIEGFQPYNWQLFMSLGFILFDSHEVAISLSFFAFILCLVAINDFTKDIFKLDINYRLLIMLLITVSPAFYNQLSIDVKIDFALLFYQIVIVHLFVKLCQAKEWNWKLIIIFGLLNGFALGIKFTHLYLLASMIIVYWGIQGGVVALLSGAAISVGAFLIAKIDEVGGLRQAHLGVDYQQWIVLAIGAGLFIFLAISEREKWLKLMRFSLLFGAIAIIPMLPWMGKNYIETKSLSPKTLLMGQAPGYQMNLNSFIKNYEAQK